MDKVAIAVIGVGTMGAAHARKIASGAIEGAKLAAVCDFHEPTARAIGEELASPWFVSVEDLLASGVCQAVLIATVHFSHTPIGIDALAAGMHVLVEKPISVHKADCINLLKHHTDPQLVFAAMFNQRTDPKYKKIKEWIDTGELGPLSRVNWIITDWFRSEAYYQGGGWRGTWNGEGGGVLLNQCPHNLDLLQWLCGMPTKVTGFCRLGARHNIEVEDEVTAYLEYANGASGVFIASTGEAPGVNRLEICGEMGRIIAVGNRLEFTRNAVGQSEFSRTSKSPWNKPETETEVHEFEDSGPQHVGIIQNFCDAILRGESLIAPASEGIHSVELANAMLYSSLIGRLVSMPLDEKQYALRLQELMDDSAQNENKGIA